MKPRFAPLYALAIIPALIVGCGDDPNNIVQPDTVAPLAPVVMGANGSNGQANVWWEANTEPDLAGYFVYAVVNGEISQVNQGEIEQNYAVVPFDGNKISLYVTAIDVSGNESNPSGTVSVVDTDSHDQHEVIEGIEAKFLN